MGYSSNDYGYGGETEVITIDTKPLNEVEDIIINFLENIRDIELDEDGNLVVHWPNKDKEINKQIKVIQKKIKDFKENLL